MLLLLGQDNSKLHGGCCRRCYCDSHMLKNAHDPGEITTKQKKFAYYTLLWSITFGQQSIDS